MLLFILCRDCVIVFSSILVCHTSLYLSLYIDKDIDIYSEKSCLVCVVCGFSLLCAAADVLTSLPCHHQTQLHLKHPNTKHNRRRAAESGRTRGSGPQTSQNVYALVILMSKSCTIQLCMFNFRLFFFLQT